MVLNVLTYVDQSSRFTQTKTVIFLKNMQENRLTMPHGEGNNNILDDIFSVSRPTERHLN